MMTPRLAKGKLKRDNLKRENLKRDIPQFMVHSIWYIVYKVYSIYDI